LRCPPAIGLEPEAERLYDSTEPPRQTSQRWRQPGLAESAQRPIHAMNKWVHNLTMLAVLYHLLVGCCWHHAHGEPRAAARQTGCALDCPDSFHHGAPHAADEPLADGSHEHQGACENPRCTFVLPDPESVYGSGHIPLFKDFYEAITQDRDPYITGEEGKKAVEIILGIYQSHKEKRAIPFPLGPFRSTDMAGVTL